MIELSQRQKLVHGAESSPTASHLPGASALSLNVSRIEVLSQSLKVGRKVLYEMLDGFNLFFVSGFLPESPVVERHYERRVEEESLGVVEKMLTSACCFSRPAAVLLISMTAAAVAFFAAICLITRWKGPYEAS